MYVESLRYIILKSERKCEKLPAVLLFAFQFINVMYLLLLGNILTVSLVNRDNEKSFFLNYFHYHG